MVRGGGGLTLWGEGGWHGLLPLVHHMALVMGMALYQAGKTERIVVTHTNLLQVVHGCCSLDRLLIRRWLCNTQLREVGVDAPQATRKQPRFEGTRGCLKHPMWRPR